MMRGYRIRRDHRYRNRRDPRDPKTPPPPASSICRATARRPQLDPGPATILLVMITMDDLILYIRN